MQNKGKVAYECEIREVDAQPVLAVRGRQVPDSGIAAFMGDAYDKISRQAAALGVQPAGMPMARYQNIDGGIFDVEALMPFAESVEGTGDVYASALQKGRAVTCEHVGPYDQLGKAYAALNEWIKEKGLQPSGPSWEEYENDPGAVPPAEYRTRLYIPIS